MSKMPIGVVAMFDALGFKGIWNRPDVRDDHNLVLAKMRGLRDAAQTTFDQRLASFRSRNPFGHLQLVKNWHVAFISDTIVLAIEPTDRAMGDDFFSLAAPPLFTVMAPLAGQILRLGAMARPALAYRGCVSVGEFAIDDTFILGPAIDEAAADMDAAEGAFVWFTESAEHAQRQSDRKVAEFIRCTLEAPEDEIGHLLAHIEDGLVPYRVPMKLGAPRSTFVINPFERHALPKDRQLITDSMLSTFGDNPKHAIKKNNTDAFLQHAGRETDMCRARAQSLTFGKLDSALYGSRNGA
jgi:hypothetical protein